MKMIRAGASETYRAHHVDSNSDSSGVRLTLVVSEDTRKHEDKETLHHRNHIGRMWVKLAKNRIAFRHDDRRGEISATLPGAVY